MPLDLRIASASTSARCPDKKIEAFCENGISPFVAVSVQDSQAAVEWDDIGITDLFSTACRLLGLREAGEDAQLIGLLSDMWFKSQLDTRSLP